MSRFFSSFEIFGLGLLFGLVLLLPQNTSAFFSSEGGVEAGVFAVGELAVALDTTTLAADISSTSAETVTFSVTETGTVAAQYELTASPVTCSTQFYSAVMSDITASASALYDGPLEFAVATSSGATTFSIELSAGAGLEAVVNETCTVALQLSAWQHEFTTPANGFTDTHTITLTLTAIEAFGAPVASNIVLNELYPSILATTTEPLDREWIELYNGTAGPIDVAGWYIGEFVGGDITNTRRDHVVAASCTGKPVSTTMQPFGTTNTVVPSGGFIILEFCGVAEYMRNEGDTIQLFDPGLLLVDGHSYGNTANGKSHARIPDGGTWVDPLPTPGGVNVATRADLEAEGWTPAEIDAVLGAESDDNLDTVAIIQPASGSDSDSENKFQFATTPSDPASTRPTNQATNTPSVASASTTQTATSGVAVSSNDEDLKKAATSTATSSIEDVPLQSPAATRDTSPDPAKPTDEYEQDSLSETDKEVQSDPVDDAVAAAEPNDVDNEATEDEDETNQDTV